MQLLVRNRVADVSRWLDAFGTQEEVARAAGLQVVHVWQDVDAPDQVYFLLDIEDRARAEAFMNLPESEAVGKRAGVIDGEVHFLESLAG